MILTIRKIDGSNGRKGFIISQKLLLNNSEQFIFTYADEKF